MKTKCNCGVFMAPDFNVMETFLIYAKRSRSVSLTNMVKVKGKAIPLQALAGPEGSRRLRLPDFKTIGT
jgi:hypothetical protein